MPVITALDPYGNIATSYAGTVHFTSTDHQATLPPDTTFDGKTGMIVLCCGELLLESVGPQSLTVTDVSNSSITGSASTSVVAQPETIEAYVSCGVLYILGDANTNVVELQPCTQRFGTLDRHEPGGRARRLAVRYDDL